MRRPALPLDKQARAWAGWAIVATLLPYVGSLWALTACALLAYAQERWDRAGHGTYDQRDFWACNAGGAIALLVDGLLQLTMTVLEV